ncbi:MAG: hypothetical protein HY017_17830 [Betaproteobacteria bacterium]|nr:hypothetical protein [Betaproteobacteria bacterium]
MTSVPDSADPAVLRLRLEAAQRKLDLLSNKQARAEAMREIARLRWQLGEITEDELQRMEEFAAGFSYE